MKMRIKHFAQGKTNNYPNENKPSTTRLGKYRVEYIPSDDGSAQIEMYKGDFHFHGFTGAIEFMRPYYKGIVSGLEMGKTTFTNN